MASGLWQDNELLLAGAIEDADVADVVNQLAVGFPADCVNGRCTVITRHATEADLDQLMVQ